MNIDDSKLDPKDIITNMTNMKDEIVKQANDVLGKELMDFGMPEKLTSTILNCIASSTPNEYYEVFS
jgi:hypothetical protein